MRISRTRHFKISMGNYESYDFGCTVTIDHSDLGYTDEDARDIDFYVLTSELSDKCMEVLNEQLAEEIKEAAQLTANEKSFLLSSFTSDSRSTTRTRKGRR